MVPRNNALLRAAAVGRLGVTSSVPSPELRRICRIAAHLAAQPHSTPVAAIHLLDGAYQHRVASAGAAPLVRSPVARSMCLPVVREGRAVYCPDARADERYAANVHVTGPGGVRLFYATPLRGADGTAIGTLCVYDSTPGELTREQRDRLADLADQTTAHVELAALSRDLADLAVRDPLTGVANRHLLSYRLEMALDDPARAPHEPALLLVDLDGFKQVNDVRGHVAGDEVLVATARRLLAAVRSIDVVARLGGDEFAVLFTSLPSASLVSEVADRVRVALAAPYATTRGEITCGASVGWTLGEPGDFAYELLGRADARMYAQKQASRSGSVTLPEPRSGGDVPATTA